MSKTKSNRKLAHSWRLCPSGEHWVETHLRWLFHKKRLASVKLKREASWIEAVAEYKSYLQAWKKNPKHKQMNKFIVIYEELGK